MAGEPLLALFEFSHFGHRPKDLKILIEAWRRRACGGELALVVTPLFAEAHPDVLAFASGTAGAPVRVVLTSNEEADKLQSTQMSKAIDVRDFFDVRLSDDDWSRQHWALFNKYAAELKPRRSLLMELDAFLLPIAMGLNNGNAFSGIYFRPSFHYRPLAGHEESRAEKVRKLHEKFLLARALKHPGLQTVFCLDPTFVAQHEAGQGPEVVFLPDPVRLSGGATPTVEERRLKERIGIEIGRKGLLFFGALDDRKGTWQLLEALGRLPEDICRRICLLVIGTVPENQQARLQSRIAALTKGKPLQILARCEFVPEEAMYAYFHATDLVLAPYQRHIGMSNIALWAAVFQKPLLTQSYGLLGELTRTHRLGLAVDTTNPTAIADAIRILVESDPETVCDRERMSAFAESHAADRFADTILDRLL